MLLKQIIIIFSHNVLKGLAGGDPVKTTYLMNNYTLFIKNSIGASNPTVLANTLKTFNTSLSNLAASKNISSIHQVNAIISSSISQG
jgi:hypothetical protein